MAVGIADTFAAGIAQKEGAVQHFVIFRAGKPCGFIIRFGDNAVRVVYADFRPGIDAVLPFPKFNQPCASLIIEIDGKGIEDHLETGRHIIVEPGVSGMPLRGIRCGRKETAVAVKTVTEGINQFVYERTFCAAVHTVYFADNFFPAAMKEDTAEKGNEKQGKE